MAEAATLGSKTDQNAVIIKGAATVFINNLPAATMTATISPHPPCHPSSFVITGSGSVFIEDLPAARVDDKIAPHPPLCQNQPHTNEKITTGSADVDIG